MRKLLLILCALGGSSFANDWRTGKPLLGYLIANTNNCLDRSRLNKLMGMIWYQGESEAFQSNSALPTDLETLRTNIIAGIDEFTEETPVIVTLINNKNDIDNYVGGVPANQFVNNAMKTFAESHGYGVVKTEDLKLYTDWIHLNAESLRM